MKKFKFLSLALAIAISAAGVFAFTQPGKPAKKFSTYHYTSNSTSLTEMQKVSNWEGVQPEEGCGQDGNIPCTVTPEGDLQTYLDSFTDPQDLIEAAASRRD